MRAAVIADIHANCPRSSPPEAIGKAVDEIWCLGDLSATGGARPCADLVRERAPSAWSATTISPCWALSTSVLLGDRGNGRLDPRERRHWTLAMLRELEPAGEGGIALPCLPRDPVWEYVLSAEQADACFDVQPARIADRPTARLLFFVRPAGAG
jgi:hypothetical protein